MTARRIIALGLMLVLAACGQGAAPGGDSPPAILPADQIAVTSLDAPAPDAAEASASADSTGDATAAPAEPDAEASEPGAEAAADVPPAVIAPPKSPAQLACERRGGSYSRVGGTDARTCVRQTRDGGKSCDRESDCQGLCLARSGTCAPITPLFGCNEIFQADGRRVTLCLE